MLYISLWDLQENLILFAECMLIVRNINTALDMSQTVILLYIVLHDICVNHNNLIDNISRMIRYKVL